MDLINCPQGPLAASASLALEHSHGFTDEELERYARHIVLREVGGLGQAKIRAAKVLVVGAGGLGSPWCFIWRRRVWARSALSMSMR